MSSPSSGVGAATSTGRGPDPAPVVVAYMPYSRRAARFGSHEAGRAADAPPHRPGNAAGGVLVLVGPRARQRPASLPSAPPARRGTTPPTRPASGHRRS